MNTLQDILHLLENYNALIKYHIKAYREGLFDEKKIDLDFDIPDIDAFKSEVKQILEQGDYSGDFVSLINWLYLVSESNSDLLVAGNQYVKRFASELQKEYPFFNSLDILSLSVFRFIHFEIWNVKDEIMTDQSNTSYLIQSLYSNQRNINTKKMNPFFGKRIIFFKILRMHI